MEISHRFFENRECKYFPCHKGLEDFNVRRMSRKQLQTFIEEWVKFKKILLMKEDREKSLLNKCQVSPLYNRKLGFEKTKRNPIWVPFCLLLTVVG